MNFRVLLSVTLLLTAFGLRSASPESRVVANESSVTTGGDGKPDLDLLRRLQGGKELADKIDTVWELTDAANARPPRPVSPAERTALEFLVVYLAEGPEAALARCARTSPHFADGRAAAAAEVSARLGPREGSEWQLQTVFGERVARSAVFGVSFPSGLADRIEFDVANVDGKMVVERIRCGAESEGGATWSAPPSIRGPWLAVDPSRREVMHARLTVFLIFLAVAAILLSARRRPLAGFVVMVVCVLLIPIGRWFASRAIWPSAFDPQPSKPTPSRTATLAHLAGMRSDFALGRGGGRGLAGLDTDDESTFIARLWSLPLGPTKHLADRVRTLTSALPDPCDRPEVEQYRLLAALLEGDRAGASRCALHAARIGAATDSAALSALVFSEPGNFASYAERARELASTGSRNGLMYFSQIPTALLSGRANEAVAWFNRGWQLRPLAPAEVVELPGSFRLFESPGIRMLTGFGQLNQTWLAWSGERGEITLPPGAVPRTVGSDLLLDVASNRIEVPGGFGLAPPGTPAVDAAKLRRQGRRQALDEIERLRSDSGPHPTKIARGRLAPFLDALRASNNDRTIVELTEGEAARLGTLSREVLLARVEALRKLDRGAEAVDLIARWMLEVPGRKEDAAVAIALSQELRLLRRFDLASRALHLAEGAAGTTFETLRTQIAVEARLEDDHREFATEHFRINFPTGMPAEIAAAIGSVLEAERQRLTAFVPVEGGAPIVVDLMAGGEFERFAGSRYVLGLFDGRVRLPLADAAYLGSNTVSTISHELLHALLARATSGNAPRWFHEGLGRHVEMIEAAANPMPARLAEIGSLSLEWLEVSFSGALGEGVTALSYDQAEWMLHYVERKFGREGIRKLIDLFRRGFDTHEAVSELTGGPPEEFVEQALAWARDQKAWRCEVTSYVQLSPKGPGGGIVRF